MGMLPSMSQSQLHDTQDMFGRFPRYPCLAIEAVFELPGAGPPDEGKPQATYQSCFRLAFPSYSLLIAIFAPQRYVIGQPLSKNAPKLVRSPISGGRWPYCAASISVRTSTVCLLVLETSLPK